MPLDVVVPGMEVVTSGDDGHLSVYRSGTNVWWAVFGDAIVRDDEFRRVGVHAPSEVLTTVQARLAAAPGAAAHGVTVAKIELDVCGAWLTVANADVGRPVVVRRAGWVDVRGHPAAPLGGPRDYEPADDRIGLGPGDAVVFQRAALGGGADELDGPRDERVLDALLAAAGESPEAIVTALMGTDEAESFGSVAVIAVPADVGPEAKERVALATGVSVDDVTLPGYPLGDLQPELWREPPRPPRMARLRLGPDLSSPRGVRRLLDRLLASWRLEGRIDDGGVRLAATELAANAVIHAQSPQSATIRYLGDVVRIEIDDRSPVMPVRREADERGGRGLPLVDAISLAWGADRRGGGKRVWFEVAVHE